MAAKKQQPISEEEIRECAIRLMEYAGTLENSDYRWLRDYEDDVTSILRGFLAGDCKTSPET